MRHDVVHEIIDLLHKSLMTGVVFMFGCRHNIFMYYVFEKETCATFTSFLLHVITPTKLYTSFVYALFLKLKLTTQTFNKFITFFHLNMTVNT